MSEKSDFGKEVFALIYERHPAAMKGEAEQSAACMMALADNIGGVIAMIRNKHGNATARATFEIIVRRIANSALDIKDRADAIVATGVSPTVGH